MWAGTPRSPNGCSKDDMKRFACAFLLVAIMTGTPTVTPEDIEKLLQSLSNWGRWGAVDEHGALNLITLAKRKQALGLAREGRPVSLAHNVIKERADDSPPFEHKMLETGTSASSSGASDVYSVQYHGFTATHMDALCHVFWKGKMYNGFSQQQVTQKGAQKLGVQNIRDGILTRGVLVDLPRLLGNEYLPANRAIYPEDLDAWEKKFNTRLASGDAVLFRTGRWARRSAEGSWQIIEGSSGLHAAFLPWLKKRDGAVAGSHPPTHPHPPPLQRLSPPLLLA